MAQATLSARIREDKGKGVARKLRRARQVPAVFYGPNTAPLKLVVGDGELKAVLRETGAENVLLQLQIESETGTDTKTVMLKELQTDPVKPVYLHADFYEIAMDRVLTLDIPIHLVNTPEGVTRGGILQQIRRELNVSCLPGKVVDSIEVDVSGLDIGDAVHVSDIELPEGIERTADPSLTAAVVSAPTVTEEKVVEEEIVEEEGALGTEATESDSE